MENAYNQQMSNWTAIRVNMSGFYTVAENEPAAALQTGGVYGGATLENNCFAVMQSLSAAANLYIETFPPSHFPLVLFALLVPFREGH
jgi:hypothetical protein